LVLSKVGVLFGSILLLMLSSLILLRPLSLSQAKVPDLMMLCLVVLHLRALIPPAIVLRGRGVSVSWMLWACLRAITARNPLFGK
jgi:hypothetical protein